MSRAPSATSSLDDAPPVESSSKRARAGTVTTKKAKTPSSFTVPSLKNCNYDDQMEHPHETPLDQVMIPIGTEIRLHAAWDVQLLGDVAAKVGKFLAEGLPLNCLVVCRSISSHEEDAMELQTMALRTMGGGSEPYKYSYEGGQDAAALFGREGMGVPLMKKHPLWKGEPAVTFREIKRRSFILVAPVVAIWPLPLSLGPKNI